MHLVFLPYLEYINRCEVSDRVIFVRSEIVAEFGR
jgi:hypothetical protein